MTKDSQMFAIVRIAGKQYLAQVGKKLKIDAKIETKDKEVKLGEVLFLADDKKVKIGKPLVADVSVNAEIISTGLDKKVLVIKHHPKKRYRRIKGHRQDKTMLLIKKINEKK